MHMRGRQACLWDGTSACRSLYSRRCFVLLEACSAGQAVAGSYLCSCAGQGSACFGICSCAHQGFLWYSTAAVHTRVYCATCSCAHQGFLWYGTAAVHTRVYCATCSCAHQGFLWYGTAAVRTSVYLASVVPFLPCLVIGWLAVVISLAYAGGLQQPALIRCQLEWALMYMVCYIWGN
jgi:hypothetical protein